MSKIRFDNSKLRGKVYEVCGDIASFSTAIGASAATVSAKIRGEADWKATEIYKAAGVLNIPITDLGAYFFTPSVEKTQQQEE